MKGTRSEEARAVESQKLLTYGFRYFETIPLYKAQESIRTVRVWGGMSDSIPVGMSEDVVLTVPRGTRDSLVASLDIPSVIEAPLKFGQALGTLTVKLSDEENLQVPIIALQDDDESGFFSSIWDAIVLLLMQLLGMDTLTV